jgi:hypothetical protein
MESVDVGAKAELAKLSGWIDETHRYANHHGALVDEINKAYGKTVIKAVPLYYGQAVMPSNTYGGLDTRQVMYDDAVYIGGALWSEHRYT